MSQYGNYQIDSEYKFRIAEQKIEKKIALMEISTQIQMELLRKPIFEVKGYGCEYIAGLFKFYADQLTRLRMLSIQYGIIKSQPLQPNFQPGGIFSENGREDKTLPKQ